MRNSDFMRSLRWILVAVVLAVVVLFVLQRRAEHGEVPDAAPFPEHETVPDESKPPRASDDGPGPEFRESDESDAVSDSAREEVPADLASKRQRMMESLARDRVRAPIELEGRVFGRGYDLTDAKAVVVQKPRNSFTRMSNAAVDEWGRFTWSSKPGTPRTESVTVSIDHPTMRCRPVVIPIDVPDERWNSDEPIRLEVELEATTTCTLHGVARTVAPDGRMTKLFVCELRDGKPVMPALASLEYGRVREIEFDVEVPIQATYAIAATAWNARPTTKVVEVSAVLAMDVGVLEIDDGAELSGHLLVDGRPLANADVIADLGGIEIFEGGLGSSGLIWWNGEFEWRSIRATTDAVGRFAFRGATLGDYEIDVGRLGESVCIERGSTRVATPIADVQVGAQLRRIDVELIGRTSITADETLLALDRTQERVVSSWEVQISESGRATFYAEQGSRISLSYNEIELHSFTVRDHERITLDVSSKD